MMIGKKIRLERIFNRNTGRTVIAPMDHGVSSGPIKGIINIDNKRKGGAKWRTGVMIFPRAAFPKPFWVWRSR